MTSNMCFTGDGLSACPTLQLGGCFGDHLRISFAASDPHWVLDPSHAAERFAVTRDHSHLHMPLGWNVQSNHSRVRHAPYIVATEPLQRNHRLGIGRCLHSILRTRCFCRSGRWPLEVGGHHQYETIYVRARCFACAVCSERPKTARRFQVWIVGTRCLPRPLSKGV
jgi:hypothetical protein